MMASQEMIDRMGAAGVEILAIARRMVEMYLPADAEKMHRDRNIGRDLAMAVFLAARGDDVVNRIALIEGFGQAIGECMAQQPLDNATYIEAALCEGLSAGVQWGRETFQPAGHA